MSAKGVLGILQVQIAREGQPPDGSGGRDELALCQPLVTLGRGKDNDVILEDPNVSGHHAQLAWAQDGWRVEDLNSRNGTHLNGKRLPPGQAAPLRPGDALRLDEFTFWIRMPQPNEPLPAPLDGQVHISTDLKPGLAVFGMGPVVKFPLEKEQVTLGRRSDNDVQLADRMVSGHHARLERSGSSYRIVDLGSTNGLTYQGQRVAEHVLADGDVLYIGKQIALQYGAFLGFVPTGEKRPSVSAQTQYLDMRSLPKTGRRITIGRHSSNVLRLNHPRVSRYHAVIEQFGARFRLHDLHSDNGTFVNGKRVDKEVWIQEGDELRIGSFRLVFQEDGISHFDEAGNLRLDALRMEKWYSKTANILKGFSISIYPKEFVALVGASGAGKSTLMNALTGFSPANGEKSRVLVNGKNLYTHMDEYRSEMGYVPQEDIIHRELTVYAALDYAAQLRMPADTSKKERDERITEVLRELGLQSQRNQLISALSGGQRKRVSIGVELLTKPGLFFLDEATSGLDPGTETEMMELLRELADGGRTVILVTHATKNVMMCDQVVFLAKGGFLAFYGPPNEALEYFEQYRTAEERRYKDKVEFDDIYRLLETRGTPQEWGERFRLSRQYKEYVVERLETLRAQQQAPTPVPALRQRRKRPVSPFRQFTILSARNLRIIAQDKVGLALMLAIAPLIGLMDFMWSRKLFDVAEGDAGRIITMLFMAGLIGILTGALSSVREIVKEVEIYRRERTVVLQLMPYVLSKVWVGVILAAYQSVIFLLAKKFFVDPQFHGTWGYSAMYVTFFLCTLSGYMLGLLISAAAPNQNIALFLVVIVLVPQFLFAGALLPRDLIPGGEIISAATSTRWALEGLVGITAIGNDVIHDPCWQLEEEQRDDLKQEDKDRLGCRCMGKQMFEQCYFPGIRSPEFFSAETAAQLNAEEPDKPPTPTPYPTFTPYPTPKPLPTPGLLGDQAAYAKKREKQAQDYQKKREAQGEDYRKLTEDQFKAYQTGMDQYGEDLQAWKSDQGKSVGGAEAMIEAIYDQYEAALKGNVVRSWLALGILSAVLFGLTLLFQKQKDVI